MTERDDQEARWNAWAEQDDRVFSTTDPRAASLFLAKLAGGGRALDLGAATGRVALAVAAQGVPVTALDISPAMVQRITEAAENLPVTAQIGDMAEVEVDGVFNVVFTTLSSFFGLLTQERQIACFRNVANVLAPGGYFVIEAFAPLRQAIVTHRQQIAIRDLSTEHVDLSATMHDPATQRITFQEIRFNPDGMRMLPIEIRYAWPSELDLMARLAGLSLRARFCDWEEGRFGPGSSHHVSLYGAS